MASIEEIKGQILMAAALLDEVTGYFIAIEGKLEQASGAVQASFEGTGRQELQEALQMIMKLSIDASDMTLTAAGTATKLHDTVAML